MNVILYKTTNRRSGVTLIEMLVVVAIMMFMLAIAAPLFRPDQDNAVARDTARALNAYIQEARAKAIATGRPCGVAFIPFEGYPSACVVAQQVELPPLYSGETYQSTVTVSGNASKPTLRFNDASATWTKEGNLIRFASRGVWYVMTSATQCQLQHGDLSMPDNEFRPWTNGPWTTTYEIQAAPVSKAKNYLQSVGMAEPFKVVRGSAIDLSYSGVGLSMQFNNDKTEPIIIMFTPTGEIGPCYRTVGKNESSSVTFYDQNYSIPVGDIYILCGQWDRSLTGYNPEDGLKNYQTLDSYWVIINPINGHSRIEQNVQYNARSVNVARSQLNN